MSEKIFGYCRISRRTQNIERQIRNILAAYPNADIRQEAYTGTRVEGRKEWCQILNDVNSGDTIVFDSVSRMSRNAEDGIKLYFELYNKGINLVFLKESYIDTDTYKSALSNKIEMTGEDVDIILQGVNQYLVRLAEKQIRLAFEQAQKEVDDLHQRTKEGIETARRNGKQIGQKQGNKLNIKKSEPIKKLIKRYSRDFDGNNNDVEAIAIINATRKEKGKPETWHISRNTYYKYKRELLESEEI